MNLKDIVKMMVDQAREDAETLAWIQEYLDSVGLKTNRGHDELRSIDGHFIIAIATSPRVWIHDNRIDATILGEADIVGEVNLNDPNSLDEIVRIIKKLKLDRPDGDAYRP